MQSERTVTIVIGPDTAGSQPPEFGTLEAYAARLTRDPDAPEWGAIYWTRDGRLVAAALAEPWYQVGGPEPYHDSYTMRVFLDPRSVADALAKIPLEVGKEGGCIDRIIDLRRGA